MSLTTLANVKAFMNISTSEHDVEILRLLPSVDAFIQSYCNRPLEQATVTEFHSGRSGQSTLRLKRYPVASITSIADDPYRVYGAETLLAASDSVLTDAEAGIVQLDGITFNEGLNNIKIVYVAGYAAGSKEAALLEQAAIELIWLARKKGDQALLGLQSRSIADGRVDTFNMDWPAGVREILERFRKVDH
ncbi:MAG: phage head-tail connector protein [Nitrospira sp.]|nr:phage head-tail connector protein [Nitrospira sp.]